MTYILNSPPFSLKFAEMTKKELREYFAWFQDAIPERMRILAATVQSTPGFEKWRPGSTEASLKLLGEWLAKRVSTRKRTQTDMANLRERSAFPIEIPDYDLTDETFSLAMDVGMYVSQVFLGNHKELKWDQQFANKKSADYGQPVLVGFGRAPFNPVWVVVTLCYGFVSGNRSDNDLHSVYDVWAAMIK